MVKTIIGTMHILGNQKRQHQVILSMADTGIPSYLVKASGKPSINNGEVTLDHD